MTDSPTLFDVPVREVRDVPVGEWRHSDPATSVEAAQRITGKTERLILELMGKMRSATWTADELCESLPTVFPPTLKSALSRLANHKLIEATGATRLSDRGCAQQVWRLVP